MAWINHPDVLYDRATMERPSMEREMGLVVHRMLEDLASHAELIPVCARDGYGMPDLYTFLQNVFAGSEDMETGFR